VNNGIGDMSREKTRPFSRLSRLVEEARNRRNVFWKNNYGFH